ncbi:MAG: hypothetical protein ACLPN1_00910 [Dissulfurispiraceae bacterium]
MKRMILIMDDSSTDMELAEIALEATEREISVCSAADGTSALSMLRIGHGCRRQLLYSEAFGFGPIQQRLRVYCESLATELEFYPCR